MGVESAADRASFFADFGEFDEVGDPAMQWTVGAVTTPVPGHFHRGSVRIEAEDGAGVLNNRATFHCAVEALPLMAATEQAVTFKATDYIVKSIEPDGTGLAVVLLEEAYADDEPPGDGPLLDFSVASNSQFIGQVV